LIPTPTPKEIRAAFEVLDCAGLSMAMKLRRDVERTARLAARDCVKHRRREPSTATPSAAWPRESVVIMWVLWKAFDQYLEHTLRRDDKRNTSIH
jgi:hypothetical protein